MLKKLVIILILLISINSCYAATIYGNIYDPDLNKIKGRVEVEVNSLPRQYKVSTDGTYSFFLLVGKYTIKARYEEYGGIKYIAEENIVVKDEGRFIHDITMYPSIEEEERLLNETGEKFSNTEQDIFLFIIIGSVFVISILLVVYFLKKGKKKGNIQVKKEETSEIFDETKEDIENPESLDGVIKIIKENKGRITQKDIRKQIPLSEAKISLMITELESKGIVRRIKKGRGNIIILN